MKIHSDGIRGKDKQVGEHEYERKFLPWSYVVLYVVGFAILGYAVLTLGTFGIVLLVGTVIAMLVV